MRMDRLDHLVTQHLADRLLEPERLTTLLSSLAGRRAEKAAAVDRRLELWRARPGRRRSGYGGFTSSWKTAATRSTTS